MKNKIFINFRDWYSNSKKHGCTSASRDWLEEIWKELEPTIYGSDNDYRKAYRELCLEETERRCRLIDYLIKYIDVHKKEEDPTFWKWYFETKLKEESDGKVK